MLFTTKNPVHQDTSIFKINCTLHFINIYVSLCYEMNNNIDLGNNVGGGGVRVKTKLKLISAKTEASVWAWLSLAKINVLDIFLIR